MSLPEEWDHIDQYEYNDDNLPEFITLDVSIYEKHGLITRTNIYALQHTEGVFGQQLKLRDRI